MIDEKKKHVVIFIIANGRYGNVNRLVVETIIDKIYCYEIYITRRYTTSLRLS